MEFVFSAIVQTVRVAPWAELLLYVKLVLWATVRMQEPVFSVFSHALLAIQTRPRTIVSPAKHLCISQLLFQIVLASPTQFQTVSATTQPTLLNVLPAQLITHSIHHQIFANSTVLQTVWPAQPPLPVLNVYKDISCLQTELVLSVRFLLVHHVQEMEWHVLNVSQDFTPFQDNARSVQVIVQPVRATYHAALWSNRINKFWWQLIKQHSWRYVSKTVFHAQTWTLKCVYNAWMDFTYRAGTVSNVHQTAWHATQPTRINVYHATQTVSSQVQSAPHAHQTAWPVKVQANPMYAWVVIVDFSWVTRPAYKDAHKTV